MIRTEESAENKIMESIEKKCCSCITISLLVLKVTSLSVRLKKVNIKKITPIQGSTRILRLETAIGLTIVESVRSVTVKGGTSLLLQFSLFRLNWPRIVFYNPIYKNEFFFFQNSHSIIICTRYI